MILAQDAGQAVARPLITASGWAERACLEEIR